MTEIAPSSAEAGATTVVATPTPETPTHAPDQAAAAQPAPEGAPQPASDDDQPRGTDGRFVKRTEKLQSQIDTLTATKRQTEREVLMLQNQAAELRKQMAQPVEIDPTDFDAQTRHSIRSVLNEEKLQQTEAATQRAAATAKAATVQIIEAQVEELREHIPDIDNIFLPQERGGPAITSVMAEGIARAENGALIAHYLMKNPREATRIAHLDPVSALVEVGLIAARIKPTQMKRISQAPAPVPTVSGGNASPVLDLSTASFKDYEAMRLKQMEGRS